MPPLSAALDELDALACPAPDAAAQRPTPAAMWFGEVPITETQSFPPPPARHCWIYLTLNAEIALSVPGNDTLRRLLQQERVRVSVDGQWLWWALRRKYPAQPLVKLSGSDLIHVLAERCAREGRRLLLLGSTPEANGAAVMRLQARHPGLAVAGFAPTVGALDTPAGQDGLAGVLRAIDAFGPDYVVLGFGAAKEQRLVERLAPRLDGRVTGLLCFGGAIDMASGQVRRAPAWMQRRGLESVFRVWEQPARLPRLLRTLPMLPTLAAGRY